jgi:ABC-type uncharacterized transport system substrate-binding protein
VLAATTTPAALAGKRATSTIPIVFMPDAATIGVLVNPNFPDAESQSRDVKEAARKLGQQVQVVEANSENDFERAFATFVQIQARALLVTADPFVQ